MTAGPVTSIMAGSRCVGFLFRRGVGVEAFEEQRSLGLFNNQAEAIAAVAASRKTHPVTQEPRVADARLLKRAGAETPGSRRKYKRGNYSIAP